MNIRIGYGEDIHALVKGRELILGGVHIPFEKGLLGHSDADVLYHAISDAILGSLALGDIGKIFPPSDPKTEGIDSGIILEKCFSMIREQGYRISNLDSSICCETPHLSKYISIMRKNIAKILEIPFEDVSVKAMTNEGFDALGEGKAIKAIATVLIYKEASL